MVWCKLRISNNTAIVRLRHTNLLRTRKMQPSINAASDYTMNTWMVSSEIRTLKINKWSLTHCMTPAVTTTPFTTTSVANITPVTICDATWTHSWCVTNYSTANVEQLCCCNNEYACMLLTRVESCTRQLQHSTFSAVLYCVLYLKTEKWLLWKAVWLLYSD